MTSYRSFDDNSAIEVELDSTEETERPTQIIQKIFTLHNEECNEFQTFIHEEPIDFENPDSEVSFSPTLPMYLKLYFENLYFFFRILGYMKKKMNGIGLKWRVLTN